MDSPSRLSLKQFCSLVEEVLLEIPEEFAPWLENVVVDVESEPTAELLEELGYEPHEELFGLFIGRAVTEQEYGEHSPNRIVLFQRPLERASRSRDEVAYEIRRTVLHELAHHFGYSEDDLDDFESRPSPFDEPSDDD